MAKINLETFCGGALSEQMNRALQEVARNIQDPNTDAEKVRRLTITLTFRPSEDRSLVKTEIQSKTALAPAAPIKTTIVTGKDLRTGAVEVAEYAKQVPGQMVMGEDGKTFDPMTGEIADPAEKERKNVRLVRAE